jgi:dTDP-glucose pyrophosphorylase/CBS domain-containing protein
VFTDLETLCVHHQTIVSTAIAQMNTSRAGIVLVVDEDMHLLGTITDGDVRRAMVTNITIDSPVHQILDQKSGSTSAQPIVASSNADSTTLLTTLLEHSIRHLPIIDSQKQVVGLVTLDEFITPKTPPLQAVIMAGGFGTRLSPLTDALPKPMLPIGDRPILELIIEQLRRSGVSKVNLTTHYKKDIIADYFRDGEGFGVEIQYVEENQPLGTAGAISLLDPSDEPILVMNGDILTDVNFRSMLDFHQKEQADMTVAVRYHEFQLPYGAVTTDGMEIVKISEKPIIRNLINAGIYLLNPSVRRLIPSGQRYDMTDLISRLIDDGRRVVSFPIGEYWIDIGEAKDYDKAQADAVDKGHNS